LEGVRKRVDRKRIKERYLIVMIFWISWGKEKMWILMERSIKG